MEKERVNCRILMVSWKAGIELKRERVDPEEKGQAFVT